MNLLKNYIFFLTVLLSISSVLFAQSKEELCKRSAMLIGMLNKYHYSPIDLNQITSEEVFNDFIDKLDPDNNIFTSADLNALLPYKTQLLNPAPNGEVCSFLKIASDLYLSRLHKVDSLINNILQKPFDFSSRDSITFFHHDTASFTGNDKELENRWARRLKFHALEMMFTPVGEHDPLKSDTKQILLKEEETRKKLSVKEKRFLQRMLEKSSGIDIHVAEEFYNAIANRYDPHTLYFTPSEKESFQASISKEAKAFGLSFIEEKNGEVKIAHLTPGGPAWKSNQLHQGDLLVQVKWPRGEALDLSYTSENEIEHIINYSEHDHMWLTVKKANGNLITVLLHKEKINVEENVITGYVLNGGKKIGYIALPGFYTEWDTLNALGCANDIAKEVLKLKKEKMEGLIIDLRFNGGGSMYEAIGLMGIFIDQGPLFIAKENNRKPVLMKDMNKGMVYNGPLIIMVNGFSASASELVAAGLRDYNRALIVGSNTFGKAIAQATLPLDTNLSLTKKIPENKCNAFVNITLEKLYRISGISHQKIGIPPDIELPDLYRSTDYGEASLPHSLSSDIVDKKVYYTPLPQLPVHELAAQSLKRTEPAGVFKRIKFISDSIHELMQHDEVLYLNPEAFKKYQKKNQELNAQLVELMKVSSATYNVLPTHYDEEVLKADNYRKEMNGILQKKILEDIYIEETFFIMNDLINLTKKSNYETH